MVNRISKQKINVSIVNTLTLAFCFVLVGSATPLVTVVTARVVWYYRSLNSGGNKLTLSGYFVVIPTEDLHTAPAALGSLLLFDCIL